MDERSAVDRGINPYGSPSKGADGPRVGQVIKCEPDLALRRPVRHVFLAWAGLTLLFAVSAPFVDLPLVQYLVGGSLYSLFLVVIAVGIGLLNLKRRNVIRAYVAAGMIFVPAAALPLILIVNPRVSMDVIGVLLRISQVLLGVFIVALALLSLCGWARFFRQSHNIGQSESSPVADELSADDQAGHRNCWPVGPPDERIMEG